jgi:signal recognition particle subunit SEC65
MATPKRVRIVTPEEGAFAQQNRLIWLCHAGICKDEDCKQKEFCNIMKNVYHHLKGCHQKDCTVPRCRTSRYVVLHYRHCKKDMLCDICRPLRKARQKMDFDVLGWMG